MRKLVIRKAETPADIEAVQALCWEYRDYLYGFDSSMQQIVDFFYPPAAYADLMASLPEKHAPPRGQIVLADLDDRTVGCAMTHPLNDTDAEIKRVFVTAKARGSGAGKMLSEALIDHAREQGYRRILLDTNAKFTGARKLYEKLGFKARGPYQPVPPEIEPLMAYYELTL